ncbi:MAG: polynucleotide adenylyltransferase PcnB [Treponema sp.]|nr:polynucleotide adenylyltransferase PcnB [Treponema sp.]
MRIRYSTREDGKRIKKAAVYTQDEHGINFSDIDSDAVSVVTRLKASGHEAYIVGGAVRDLILGKKPKDFDIACDASPARIKKIFRNARIIGHRFRLVHVYFGPKIFEVSTFRSRLDSPESNIFGTIDEDVLRRDFTFNALFYDPQQQIVVDYVGGMKDIRSRCIRPIIPLSMIFSGDPVRMIRAVKYSAITGFPLSMQVRWKIRKQAALLASVSPSRLTEEINKIIHSSQAGSIVTRLEELGLYRYLQPGASRLMKEKPVFRSRYLSTLGLLNKKGFKNRSGEILSALIRDYLEEEALWDEGQEDLPLSHQEIYKNVFAAARSFVLPMNPPRMELDHAVRMILAEHGIVIKKSHFAERNGAMHQSFHSRNAAHPAEIPGESSPAKRRRRRRPTGDS